jgi:hypothetical protein
MVGIQWNRVGEEPSETSNATPSETWQTLQTDYPLGALVQVAELDGKKAFVLHALAPNGGKFHARWLHLFGPEATEHARAHNETCHNLYDLNYYAAFNANIHPDLTALKLHISGQAKAEGWLSLNDLEVFALPQGGIGLRKIDGHERIWIADAGLEGHTSRPLLVQVLLAAGQPAVSKHQWPQNALLNLGNHVKFRPRKVEDSIVIHRAEWVFDTPFWTAFDGLTDADFFKLLRHKLHELGLPKHCWLHLPKEKGSYFCCDNPLMVNALWKKSTQQCTIILEEMLPVPDGFATEISVAIG